MINWLVHLCSELVVVPDLCNLNLNLNQPLKLDACNLGFRTSQLGFFFEFYLVLDQQPRALAK
jgi:hypothetical protein